MRDPEPASRAYLATCGGLFRDMTIHNFDNVRWLMGDAVEEVFAMGSALVDPMFAELNDVDTSIVSLRFANGGLAVIDNSRRSGFGYDVRTEIFGSEGALFVGYTRDTAVLHSRTSGVQSDHVHWFLERFDDAYVGRTRRLRRLRSSRTARSRCHGEDGRAALAMAYAGGASLQEHDPCRSRIRPREARW